MNKTVIEALSQEQLSTLLSDYLGFVIKAHSKEFAKKKSRIARFHDGVMPYAIHPIQAALTFAQDEVWSLEFRVRGMLVLLGHDVLEDTTLTIPEYISKDVTDFIEELTYADDNPDIVRKSLDEKSSFSILCKLYDCLSNVMDATKLINEFEPAKNYPMLCKEVLQRVQMLWKSGELNEFVDPYFLESGQKPNVLIMAEALFKEKLH